MNRGVIGLQFGDEGKGKVTSILARKYDCSVVRYSGGQQAGHRVVSKESGSEHIFASFGSGTLSGRPTIWSKYCTINPYALINEMEILKKFSSR
jgi:adenylosuccinate synthase